LTADICHVTFVLVPPILFQRDSHLIMNKESKQHIEKCKE
jgi:hypothetical protein